jgi:primosomal replication protein N
LTAAATVMFACLPAMGLLQWRLHVQGTPDGSALLRLLRQHCGCQMEAAASCTAEVRGPSQCLQERTNFYQITGMVFKLIGTEDFISVLHCLQLWLKGIVSRKFDILLLILLDR